MGTYGYGYDGSVASLEEFFALVAAESIFNPLTLILNVVSYVLLAISLYTIAKRRGIQHAWLAWIPIGSTWLLGCISDQYQYVARRQEKNKRKVMLVLEILVVVACVVMIALVVAMCVDLFTSVGFNVNLEMSDLAIARMLQYVGWVVVAALVTLGLSIALAVLTYMAYYDLFASCEPNNKVVFLLLGIFFGVLMSIFAFACRNKDYGMPPRHNTAQPTMWTPPQQTWQPPQPPVEPWEQNRE